MSAIRFSLREIESLVANNFSLPPVVAFIGPATAESVKCAVNDTGRFIN